ncbi:MULTISPECIES: DUF2231 domain-containing protein [Corynebacterium]|uniref:DUF2231 domain-containing protein n=1 Tax=Corynebacterium TaxID=1716 RepID=UPI002579A443|nr:MULTISPECIES: DUF2231 domain-containing protein [Corynebacterium]
MNFNIGGIPAHPLFVHGAVVLIPLTALVLIAWVFVPRWKQSFAIPTLLGGIVSFVVLILTRQTGEALPKDPGIHETYAGAFTIAVFLMVVAIIALFWAYKKEKWTTGLGWTLRIVAAVLAVAVLVTSVLTGHSGAALVWN